MISRFSYPMSGEESITNTTKNDNIFDLPSYLNLFKTHLNFLILKKKKKKKKIVGIQYLL